MKANRAAWPIATMARLLEVSASGFYAWLERAPWKRACSDADLHIVFYLDEVASAVRLMPSSA